ncbi:MAG: hypothetical protein NZ730_06495, partial [Porticoccaceae bacterium]|nr:hypothetical protein [Porticoccaceae bacterium]
FFRTVVGLDNEQFVAYQQSTQSQLPLSTLSTYFHERLPDDMDFFRNGESRIRQVKGGVYVLESPIGTTRVDQNGVPVMFKVDSDTIANQIDDEGKTLAQRRATAHAVGVEAMQRLKDSKRFKYDGKSFPVPSSL